MRDADVIIVGAGMAGSVAACRATELGLAALLLDAADDSTGGGNTSLSGGGIHIARLSLNADPARLRRRILWGATGVVREHLADRICSMADGAMRWLLGQGVVLETE